MRHRRLLNAVISSCDPPASRDRPGSCYQETQTRARARRCLLSPRAPGSLQEVQEEGNDGTMQEAAEDESASRVQPPPPELVVHSNVPPTHVAGGKVYEYAPTMPMPMHMPYGHGHIMNTPSGSLMTYG